MIKGLSLWNPWAGLMELDAKRIETRSWSTDYRGPVLICSTSTQPRGSWDVLRLPTLITAMRRADVGSKLPHVSWGPPDVAALYRGHFTSGAALAVGHLVACFEVSGTAHRLRNVPIGGTQHIPPFSPEREFGNYQPGRFAWLFHGIRALPAPLSVRGRQRLWNVPPDVMAKIPPDLLVRPPGPWVERGSN